MAHLILMGSGPWALGFGACNTMRKILGILNSGPITFAAGRRTPKNETGIVRELRVLPLVLTMFTRPVGNGHSVLGPKVRAHEDGKLLYKVVGLSFCNCERS